MEREEGIERVRERDCLVIQRKTLRTRDRGRERDRETERQRQRQRERINSYIEKAFLFVYY